MRFLCLGYRDEASWAALRDAERAAFREECRAFDDELRRCGHLVTSEPAPNACSAITLRHRFGRLVLADGPCVAAEVQLDRVLILEARDLNHAIHLVSRRPEARTGAVEIRPALEIHLPERSTA